MLVALLMLTHCAVEHGRRFVPVMVTASAALPAGLEVCDRELTTGAPSAPAADEIVNGLAAEVPAEFVTVTATVPGSAAWDADRDVVSCVALTKVVACGAPFQFTTASLVKFAPFTVSVNAWAAHAGVDAAEVVDAEREVIEGALPAGGAIVNRTTFEISVVVVL